MKSLRHLALWVVTGALLALAPACGSKEPVCGPGNCAGCCDAAGQCQSGLEQTTCGVAGGACVACPGSQSCVGGFCAASGGGQTGSVTMEQFCSSISTAYCEYLVRCGDAHALTSCRQLFDSSISGCFESQAPAIKDGRATYHADRAGRCLDDIKKTAVCSGFFSGAPGPDCATFIEGAVATGAMCFIDEECGANDYCTATTSSCPGTCQPRVGEGQPIGTAQCLTGLYAYNDGTQALCRAYTAIGQSCAPEAGATQQKQCVEEAYCDATTSLCTSKKALNSSCTEQWQCAANLRCMSGTCQALAGLDATCSTTTGVQCKVDLFCRVSPGDTAGVCTARGAAGASCLNDNGCEPTLHCAGEDPTTVPPTSGTCAAKKPAGAACASGSECEPDLYCDAVGACQVRKAKGTACTNSQECVSSLTCSAGICSSSYCSDPTP